MEKENCVYPVKLELYKILTALLKASSLQCTAPSLPLKKPWKREH